MRKCGHFIIWSIIIGEMLTACSFAPHYQRPEMKIPAHYKEAGKWIEVKPKAPPPSFKSWWTLYHDRTLNELERRVTSSNQNLKVAVMKYQKALDIAQAVQSQQYPNVLGIGVAARQRNSPTLANNDTKLTRLLYNTFLLGFDVTYEIDVWGRVRNSVLAADKLARASEYDLAVVDLSLHAELASDYFKLRAADAMQQVLDKNVAASKKTLFLTRQQFKWGVVSIIAVDAAVSQFEHAQTLASDMRLKRSQLEHAIAVLVGVTPAQFSLPKARQWQNKIVAVPLDLPSSLLINRPDIAAQIRRVEAANATIGVARAAFFPIFNFIGLAGMQSSQLGKLFSGSSLFWALGPPTTLALIQPEASVVLFDGYKLQAQLKYAKDSYYEAVANYRQTSLTAFQEVEDALVALRRLGEENLTQARATRAVEAILYQESQRYKGGIVPLQTVLIAENQAYESELALIQLQTRYQLSSVQLVKALGGGWHDAHFNEPEKRPCKLVTLLQCFN